MPSLYLAGPITGHTFDGCTEWRITAQLALKALGITAFSPMRGKQFLQNKGILTGAYEDHPYASSKGIMTRDHHDCTTCDLVLAYLPNQEKLSLGTVMELAWSYHLHKPVVAILDKDSEYLKHPMVYESIGFKCYSLEDAIDVVRGILLP